MEASISIVLAKLYVYIFRQIVHVYLFQMILFTSFVFMEFYYSKYFFDVSLVLEWCGEITVLGTTTPIWQAADGEQ